MSRFYQKRSITRFLYSPFTVLPLLGFVVLLGASVWSVYTKERETRLKRNTQTVELRDLEARAGALSEEIERLSTDRGREEEIRGKFEVAREGEHVIVIIDPQKEVEEVISEPKKSFWQKFLEWF